MQSIELTQAHDGTWSAKGETLADRIDDWNDVINAFRNIEKEKGDGKHENT